MVKSINEPFATTLINEEPPPQKTAVVVEDGTTEVLGETIPPTGVPPIEEIDPTPPDPEAPIDQRRDFVGDPRDPDDMEDELDQAEEDGDYATVGVKKTTTVKAKKK